MPKFKLNAAINVRAYGVITVTADTLEEAKAMITEDENFDMEKHFEPHGSGDDDFEWKHFRPMIFINSVSYETDDDEVEADIDEDWPTKEERADEEKTAALLAALRAIRARIEGIFDHPDLIAAGPLSPDIMDDVLRIAHRAIYKAEEC